MHAPKHILIFLSILLFFNLAFSQVVIKDTVVITPKGKAKSLSISNPQYYNATVTISCDALNGTHDPTFARGSIDAQIGDSAFHLANALQPADLGRTGVVTCTSPPITLDAPVQITIGGIQCTLTQDNPLFFEVIVDSISVGSVVYQETFPFPAVGITYPLNAQDIFGATSIHAEAQVDPSPDNSATVTWSVSPWPGDEWTSTPADIDLTGYDGIYYVKATATNKCGSTEALVQVAISPMNPPPGNKVYPRYSGTLTVQATPDLVDSSFYDPSNAMQLTMNGNPLLSSSVLENSVHVSQWGPLDFELSKNGYKRGPGLNTEILETNGFAQFDETDYSTLYSFEFSLAMDSTQEALPPDWLYTYSDDQQVDPFVPSQTTFIAPVSGELMLQITDTSTAAIDSLFLLLPAQKFLLNNPAAYIGDTVDCGKVTAGDTIQFYLHSNEKIVADMNMYPEIFLGGGGGGASIAVRGGPSSGVSSSSPGSLLFKSHTGKKTLQEKLLAEKVKKIMGRRPLSSSRVPGLQQKKVKVQATHHSKRSSVESTADDATPVTTLVFDDGTDLDWNDVSADTWIEPSYSILLGETKYYHATDDPNNSSNLLIAESYDPSIADGDGRVIFEDPTASSADDKVGTYFDYDKPDGSGLDNGVVRLIGRYLKDDTTQDYKVTLNAVLLEEGRSGSITVEVKRPVRLLTPNQSPTYRLSRDVFNNEINIDDTCITYGGRYGIPPQFLKGQMFQEAGKINFTGYTGFAPSYRYEPFNKYQQLSLAWTTDKLYKDKFWLVDSSRTDHKMGLGKDVPIHQHVLYMNYPTSPKTVWDIIYDNSELVNTGSGAEHQVYGKRLSSGKMVFPSQYRDICKTYNEFLHANAGLASLFSSKSKEDIAREKMIEYLRDKWETVGANKMTAQTRLASSYGLLQLTYDVAVRYANYPSNDPNVSPEDFNVTTTNMSYSLKYMKQLLQQWLTPNTEQNGCWPNGFEHWFKDYVWPIWNTNKHFSNGAYANGVYSNAQKFEPQSQ